MSGSQAGYVSKTLGHHLRFARGALGLTQSNIAELMHEVGWLWTDQTVGCVERGDRAVTVDEAVALSRCLNLDLDALLGLIPLVVSA